MPLRRHLLCASTPGSKLPSVRRCNLSNAFRPRGFSPPRRFTPHTGPRACCIPQPARVRRVLEAAEPVPSEDGGGPPSLLPATRVHTLRRVSSSTAGAASLRSVAILSFPALIRSSPRPKQRRESVLANQEPRGRRPGRSRISNPLAWAVVSCTVKLRSAANGGPPRHRGTWTPANRRPACADRHSRRRRSVSASERSSPEQGGMPARRKEEDFTSDAREHPSRAVERPRSQDHSCTPESPR